MLALITEAISLRDLLVNVGTSLLWKVRINPSQLMGQLILSKVAHYGLPAAGLICLFMLRPAFWQPLQDHSTHKILLDLGNLASAVQLGSLLPKEAPYYNLLYRAASTILGLVSSHREVMDDLERIERSVESLSQPEEEQQAGLPNLNLSAYSYLWGCKISFWQDLGAYPSLLTPATRL